MVSTAGETILFSCWGLAVVGRMWQTFGFGVSVESV